MYLKTAKLSQNGCTILHLYQPSMRVMVITHLCQGFELSEFFYFGPSNRYMLYFFLVLICISLITHDIEHLSMCLFATISLLRATVYSNPLLIKKIFLVFYTEFLPVFHNPFAEDWTTQ